MPRPNTPFRLFGRAPLLLAALVCLLALPGLIGFLHSNARAIQEGENRNMAALPPFKLWRENAPEYIRAWEARLKDSVGFRRQASVRYLKLKYHLFHDEPIGTVTMGHSGHVFLNSTTAVRYAFFDALCVQAADPSPELLNELDAAMRAASRYFRRFGAKTIFAVVPTSLALYPDKLPSGVPPALRRACMEYPGRDHAYARLERLGEADGQYRVFYPLGLFNAHKQERHFWPKELFHWEGRSTYLFARTLLKESGAVETVAFDDPAAPGPAMKDDLSVFFGFTRPVTVWSYPYAGMPTERRAESWLDEAYDGKRNLYAHYVTEGALSPKTALMFADSFGEALEPHLARGFAHFYALSTNWMRWKPAELFAAAAGRIRPDYVFFVYNDTNITSLPRWLAPFVELEQEAARQDASAGETVPAHDGSRGESF